MCQLAYIGLGSNLASPEQQVEFALAELDAIEQTRLLTWSSLYRTAPIDVPGEQPDYINAVALLRTKLAPEALLAALRAIELRHGERAESRNAPRALDLDLLMVDEIQRTTHDLVLPHPRLHQRAFVLVPLREIAPEIEVPGQGSAKRLLAAIANDPRQRVIRVRPARPTALPCARIV